MQIIFARSDFCARTDSQTYTFLSIISFTTLVYTYTLCFVHDATVIYFMGMRVASWMYIYVKVYPLLCLEVYRLRNSKNFTSDYQKLLSKYHNLVLWMLAIYKYLMYSWSIHRAVPIHYNLYIYIDKKNNTVTF